MAGRGRCQPETGSGLSGYPVRGRPEGPGGDIPSGRRSAATVLHTSRATRVKMLDR